jgi:hypothetical protein
VVLLSAALRKNEDIARWYSIVNHLANDLRDPRDLIGQPVELNDANIAGTVRGSWQLSRHKPQLVVRDKTVCHVHDRRRTTYALGEFQIIGI